MATAAQERTEPSLSVLSPSTSEVEDVKDVKREDIHNELRNVGPLRVHPEDRKFDQRAVRRLTLKMDLVFVPMTFIGASGQTSMGALLADVDPLQKYTFCFIDRSSIGNAGIAGFKTNLGLVGNQYNLGVSLFFIAYVIFQAPSNVALKFVGAKLWVSFLIISFGAITFATGWIKSRGSFYAVRFLLGMVEGGVLSGMAFMLSMFYPREQVTLRIGVYMLCASSSGAFGGILAYGLIQIGPKGDLFAWSWIFIVEGAISMFLAFCVFLIIPSSIESAWFLNEDDKRLARKRMHESNRLHENASMEKTQWHLIYRALRDPLNWGAGLCYIGVSFVVQSLAIFTPTILTGLGYTVLSSQIMSIWPNLVGFFTNLAILFASNYTNVRTPFIVLACAFDMIGFGMLLSTDHHVQYGGLFVANLLSSVPGPLLVGFAGGNNAPLTTRACAIAMPTTLGHLGAIASAWSFQSDDGPRYLLGNGLNFAFAGWSLVFALLLILYVTRENRKRAAGGRDDRLTGDRVKDGELGSLHPEYRLIY